VVLTERGPVGGVQAGATWAYRGIPYAAPPVGDLRFRPPADHACWKDTLPAHDYGAKCLQLDANDAVVGSEDCLTVNVWAPASATPAAPKPVLFFIHGGGNVQGSASEEVVPGTYTYDGQALAEARGVVVVTIQYRVQAAGWLTLPELAAESAHQASGNYGTLDQIFALGWVQRNIQAFGGDPAHVLLFGESAGAEDTCAVLSSPLAKGLFSAALMESGGCGAMTRAQAEAFGATVAQAAGCQGNADVPACLRALSPEALVKAVPASPDIAGKQPSYQPHVDGWALPLVPLDALSAGSHNHVPFVVGSNRDETGKSVGALTDASYQAAVLKLAGGIQAIADQILAEYPISAYASPRAAYVALTSDAKFICSARTIARAAVKGQTEPVYRYFFTHTLENGSASSKAFGAFHGEELLFVFAKLSAGGYQASAGETGLSQAMGGYWSRLAAGGDPNGEGAVAWPRYDAPKDSYLGLDDTIAAGEGVRTAQCDFWDAFSP
jgi:para-nitrobenzyl esterase